MTNNKSKLHSSKKSLWITGTVAAALVVVGAVGYALYKQNQKIETLLLSIQQTNNASAPTTSALNSDELAKAVEQALENRNIEQQQHARKERTDKYSLANNSIPSDKHIYGNYEARFTLVEFSDIECPYCKRFHDTPKSIVDQSQGHVNWQWKHLPLSFHNPVAEQEAEASECVADIEGNQMFWVYLDELFKHTRGGGQGADVMSIAQNLGIDIAALKQCLTSGKFKEKVQNDIAQATKMGITGTPATFVVDNQTGKTQLLSGAQPEQAFISTIRKMMEEGKNK